MNNLWQQMREHLLLATLVLLCMIVVPTAQANTGNNGGASTASTEGAGSNGGAAVTAGATSTGGATVTANAQQTNGQSATAATNDPAKGKQKASSKPRDKSVLDAEVLESPIGYFKNAFSSEEESSEAAPSSNAVMLTVKALVATLLSTIM